MHLVWIGVFIALNVCLFSAVGQGHGTVWLASLELQHALQGGWQKKVEANKSVDGNALTIGGKVFARGVGAQAQSIMYVDLHGDGLEFSAWVGVDDEVEAGKGGVRFQVVGDDKLLFDSGVMSAEMAAREVKVDLRGMKRLILLANQVGEKNDGDHADWGEAKFVMARGTPRITPDPDQEGILTPPPPHCPRINGPTVYGARPGHPFLYRIPATGDRPMRFAAAGLPEGLRLDATSGIISGVTPAQGRYEVKLTAENAQGRDEKRLAIVAGDTLALTPPMGWNTWYAYYKKISDVLMRDAAQSMIRNGMADAGYDYVNIDDCWSNGGFDKDGEFKEGPGRDARGNILPNHLFPDMKAMTDYIHGLGLKAGIYSSPGPKTCTWYTGSFEHEEQDAAQFAAWGFDFLKYDLCSYKPKDESPEELQKPYRLMGELLKRQNRDMVFNICEYGKGEVWKWGGEVGGHCWRTGGDLGFELNRIFQVALRNATCGEYSRPGEWNDPDYLQVGRIGNIFGPGMVDTPLTHNEQYAFMSLWCLMAAPLVYSGEIHELDDFTTNVLCNAEVIAVDQDPLGKCGRVIRLTEDTFLMVKDLEDGSMAVGLCNQGRWKTKVTAKWADLGRHGGQKVRDLWRQKDMGTFSDGLEVIVPSHGVTLVRIEAAEAEDVR